MSTFAQTTVPTSFGFFDADTVFQTEADSMITFVKRKLGDDCLSVELSKKQIWTCFEEAFLEYSSIVNTYQGKSQITTFMGVATGSFLSGSEQKLPRGSFEFFLRQAEPYAQYANVGGSFNNVTGSIKLVKGTQDYDLYSDLKDPSGVALFDRAEHSPKSKMRIMEVFHFNPQAAYRFFDSTSAINYLNNEFSFESFTPETVFYVLPVFEDILRAGQLKLSSKVRRSNYSYRINGTKLRIFPVPVEDNPKSLFVSVQYAINPLSASYQDESIHGVSNLSNLPFGNLIYARVNSIGRQWVRQMTLALCKELLGLIRSKFSSVPIPGGDLTLNGADLISQGREEKDKLLVSLREMLDSLTYDKLLEKEAAAVDNLQKILRAIPTPNGRCIVMG